MREFAELYDRLDQTNKTNAKVQAIADYLQTASPEDSAWAIFLLTGRKVRSIVNRTKLRGWATELAGIADWMFDECYEAVGDLSETIAKLLPEPEVELHHQMGLADWINSRFLPMAAMTEGQQKEAMISAWSQLDSTSRLVWNKLLNSNFRVGVSQDLVIRAIAKVSGTPAATISHRMMGNWTPDPDFYRFLTGEDVGDSNHSRPYPFCLAHALEGDVASLGEPGEWLAEWKWDGIRCQLIRRNGETFVWSRGEDLVHESFPDIEALGASLPDGTVLDGEILAFKDNRPMLFQDLQKRLGRKQPGKKLLQDVPAALICFDILESDGFDRRALSTGQRRGILEFVLEGANRQALRISPPIEFADWDELARIRERSEAERAEGIMLKKLSAPYEIGRKKGTWWKWKVDPFSVDAVLIYAQRGTGKRASLYTDYTFGVWDDGVLVPFAKAYSGLDDGEIREVDSFVRRNTLEKFGPVRTVAPKLVFEIAFEGIQLSTRHKSGVAVRFPRIARWRKDKKPEDADQLETVKALLAARES